MYIQCERQKDTHDKKTNDPEPWSKCVLYIVIYIYIYYKYMDYILLCIKYKETLFKYMYMFYEITGFSSIRPSERRPMGLRWCHLDLRCFCEELAKRIVLEWIYDERIIQDGKLVCFSSEGVIETKYEIMWTMTLYFYVYIMSLVWWIDSNLKLLSLCGKYEN